jgi:ABC-2 type transport system permease protein
MRSLSWTRIGGIYRRHFYVVTRSFPRVLDMTIWPFVDLLLWGMLTVYLRGQHVSSTTPITFLLGGLLLWDIVFRTKNQVALTFLEETWSRNVVAVLVAPITPTEYLTGAVLWGLTTVSIGWALIAIFAWVLFAFGIASIGLPLVVFGFTLMIFGIALALIVLGLLLRFGHDADIMAWALAFIVLPFSAVYYPLAVLPAWARSIATIFPTSHVFESMRTILAGGTTPWNQLAIGLGLDAIYLAGAFAFARGMFATLRRRGYVTRFV